MPRGHAASKAVLIWGAFAGLWWHLGLSCCWETCLDPWSWWTWGLWWCSWLMLAWKLLQLCQILSQDQWWLLCLLLNIAARELALHLSGKFTHALMKDDFTPNHRCEPYLWNTLELALWLGTQMSHPRTEIIRQESWLCSYLSTMWWQSERNMPFPLSYYCLQQVRELALES